MSALPDEFRFGWSVLPELRRENSRGMPALRHRTFNRATVLPALRRYIIIMPAVSGETSDRRSTYIHFVAFIIVVVSATIFVLYQANRAVGEFHKFSNESVYLGEEHNNSR